MHQRYKSVAHTTTSSILKWYRSADSVQYITSYTVAFLSPDPVTIYLSSVEISQLSTDEDSFDCNETKLLYY